LMHNHKEARQTQSRMSRNPCGTSSETQFQHIQRTAVGTLITIKTYTMTPELPTPRHSKEVQGSRSIPGCCMLTCSAVRSKHSSQGTPRFKNIPFSLAIYQSISFELLLLTLATVLPQTWRTSRGGHV